MAEILETSITDNAKGPKKVATDQISAEQHSLADQIAADKYLAGRQGFRSANLGIRRVKMAPPGTA